MKLNAQAWPDVASRAVWSHLLNVDVTTLYRAQKNGKLKATVSPTGRILYRQEDIAGWIGLPELPQAKQPAPPEPLPEPPKIGWPLESAGQPLTDSPPANNIARLRRTLGKTQGDFADLLGVSRNTITSVETGRLKLSDKLARRISEETGASSTWLLTNVHGPVMAEGAGTDRESEKPPQPSRDDEKFFATYCAAITGFCAAGPPLETPQDYSRIIERAYRMANYALARWERSAPTVR